MKRIAMLGLVAALYTALGPNHAPAEVAHQPQCEFPQDLKDEVSIRYPGFTLVKLADLSADDKAIFQKDHASQCPGSASVDFYGDGKPTHAIVLVDKRKKKANLIVAHKLGRWELQLLESSDTTPLPVVWRDRPGKYQDVYGEKKLAATHPVIVLCGYESWAIVYAWTGSKIEKVWISD